MQETAKEREVQNFDASDKYMDQFKKSMMGSSMAESRNAAKRSNKPIQSDLAKGSKGGGSSNIRILYDTQGDSDEDEEDDDAILSGKARDEDPLAQSYGRKGTGALASMKAKLSLQEELGALKSELSTFDADKA